MSTTCSTHHLPDEVLSLVFGAVAQAVRGAHKRLVVALSVSQVCRFWRMVALGPGGRTLWKNIPIWSTVDCARAFIERSAPLPFSLVIELGDTKWPTYVPALAEAALSMHRAGAIEVVDLYDREESLSAEEAARDEKIYQILNTTTAPLLAKLDMTFVHIAPPYDDPPLLSPDFLGGEIPQALRILNITGRRIMPDSAFLRASLTALIITSCRVWNNIDEVLGTLSHMPGLEVLVLESEVNTFCPHATDAFMEYNHERFVPLPRLKVLKIEDDAFTAPLLILAYLRVPLSTRVHLFPASSDYDSFMAAEEGPLLETRVAHDIALLRLALTAHFQAGTGPSALVAPFNTIAIAQDGNGWNFVFHAVYESESQDASPIGEFTFRYYAGPRSAAGRRRLAAVANALLTLPVMSQADLLIVSHDGLYGSGCSADWTPLCGFFPKLVNLAVSRGAIHGVLPALRNEHLFPGIESLTIAGVRLEDNEDDAARTAHYLISMHDTLRARAASAHKIPSINFCDCFGVDKLARTLKRLSPDMKVCASGLSTLEGALEREEAWDDADEDIRYMVDRI
ncbi:hypothetical protein PENSPDRAFT_732940 [Peniophora sp. CONT]|nr:hypothetical protein PENSPDRAFT_732940 [Peniophora sp. CONT]